MKRRAIIFALTLFLVSLVASSPALAAKARTSRGAGTAISSGTATGGRVLSSVRFKTNRLGVVLTLSGLNNASSVTYELTYTAAGIPQGARGTVSGGSNTATRELLFGTCSKNVCRYHTNITDARLVVTSKLNSGITTRKTFRIKV